MASGLHGSHQAWGRWEVNPGKVLDWIDPVNPTPVPVEWYQLFTGDTSPTGTQRGRYGHGTAVVPNTQGSTAPGGKRPTVYAQVDYNGAAEAPAAAGATDRYTFQPPLQTSPLNPFPAYPAHRYGNGIGELTHHARLYDYFWPSQFQPIPPATINPE